MRQLDYTGIFWTILSVQWVMFCSAFAFAFLYLWINLRQAAKNSGVFHGDGRAAEAYVFIQSRCGHADKY